MSTKLFKYQEYLNKYKNCPPNDLVERDLSCVRWVHEKPTENDFLPIPFIREVPTRKLNDSDSGCEYYGLSVFKDLKTATTAYNIAVTEPKIRQQKLNGEKLPANTQPYYKLIKMMEFQTCQII